MGGGDHGGGGGDGRGGGRGGVVGDSAVVNWPRVHNAARVVAGVLILVLAGVTGVELAQAHETDVCFRDYAVELAEALQPRSTASQGAQDGLDELIRVVISTPQTDAGRAVAAAAFRTYVAQRAAARKAQLEHPFPPIPRTCEH